MVNVNKKYLEETLKKSIWYSFINEIKKVKTEKDFKVIFDKFFTPAEQIMLEKRLAITFLLKQGLTHREIGRLLDVSPTTVSFIRRGFSNKRKKKSKPGWRHSMLERLETKKSPSRYPTFTGKGRWRFLYHY